MDPRGKDEGGDCFLAKLWISAVRSGIRCRRGSLDRYFHVVETDEKITLVNEQFVIWIVPENVENVCKTFCFIALNTEKIPRLETAFCVSGVYNSSKLVLRVLEKLLQEVIENEEALNQLKKAS